MSTSIVPGITELALQLDADGEPRAWARDVYRLMGGEPANFTRTIERNEPRLRNHGSFNWVIRRITQLTNGGGTREYEVQDVLLNYAQTSYLAARMDTEQGKDDYDVIIRTFANHKKVQPPPPPALPTDSDGLLEVITQVVAVMNAKAKEQKVLKEEQQAQKAAHIELSTVVDDIKQKQLKILPVYDNIEMSVYTYLEEFGTPFEMPYDKWVTILAGSGISNYLAHIAVRAPLMGIMDLRVYDKRSVSTHNPTGVCNSLPKFIWDRAMQSIVAQEATRSTLRVLG